MFIGIRRCSFDALSAPLYNFRLTLYLLNPSPVFVSLQFQSSTAVESNAVTVHDARPQLSALEDMKATPCVPQSECSEQTHPAGDDDQVNHTKSHDRDRLTADGMDIEKNNEDLEDGGGAGYTAQSGSQVHTAVGLTPSTVKPPNYASRPPQHVYDSLYEVEEEEEEEEIDGGGWYFG